MQDEIFSPKESYSGFWVRFAAWCLDAVVCYGIVSAIVVSAKKNGIYLPFELSFALLITLYFIAFTVLRGKTPGKAMCGIKVLSAVAGKPSLLSIVIRECLGKVLSAGGFFLGFLCIALSRRKQGWHDYLGRTIVVGHAKHTTFSRIGIACGLSLAGLLVGSDVYEILSVRLVAHKMSVPASAKSRYTGRDPATLTSLTPEKIETLSEWLKGNGKDPVDYAIEKAGKYEVTLFGEGLHGLKRYLTFFNEILPDLYQKAGVTCVALEACPSFNNKALESLVTAPEFNRELALRIARSELWEVSGYQEYWNIFETVWRVNQGIPNGQRKMRVVGLDISFDGPSWALLGLGDDGLPNVPMHEKLRAFRMLDDLAYLTSRDELMALTIEREIITKGERGVVLIGGNHAYLHYGQSSGRGSAEKRRMGYMLYQKYGDRIFQVMMYGKGIRRYFPSGWDELMDSQEKGSLGFDVAGSPFESLKAGGSKQPSVCLADVAPGIIYLKSSESESEFSNRIPGFISENMFLQNKPYYEAIAGRRLHSAKEANEHAK